MAAGERKVHAQPFEIVNFLFRAPVDDDDMRELLLGGREGEGGPIGRQTGYISIRSGL